MKNSTVQTTASQLKDAKNVDPIVFINKNLTNSSKKYLKVLLGYQETHKKIYPSQATLVKETGLPRVTVQRAQYLLMKLGMLTITQDSWNTSNEYHLHPLLTQPKVLRQLKAYFKGFMAIALLLSMPVKGYEAVYDLDVINLLKKQQVGAECRLVASVAQAFRSYETNYKEALNSWQLVEERPKINSLKKKVTFEEFEAMIAVNFKEKAMEAWTAEQLETIAAYPKKAFDYATYKLDRLCQEGRAPTSKFQYLMGIIKHFDPARDKIRPTTGTTQQKTTEPYQRPSQGPRAEWVAPAPRKVETDFEFFCNVERIVHEKNIRGELAPRYWEFHINPKATLVTDEQYEQGMSVHVDCSCNPNIQRATDGLSEVIKESAIKLAQPTIKEYVDAALYTPVPKKEIKKEDLRPDFDNLNPDTFAYGDYQDDDQEFELSTTNFF